MKTSSFLTMATVALLALSACDQKQAAKTETTPLTVHGALGVLELAPLLRAAEMNTPPVTVRAGGVRNLSQAENATEAEVNASANAVRGATGFNPGHADLAGNAETQFLRTSAVNPDQRILMTVVAGDYRMVARKSSGITKLEDLKGKRIATTGPNSSAGYYTHRALASVGLTVADVTTVPMSAKEGADALIAGTVDAFAIWEPEPQRAMEALGDEAVEIPNGGVYYEHYNLYSSTPALNDPAKRAQIVAYVRNLLKVCEEAVSSPDRMIELVAQSTKYDAALIKRSWHHHRFPCAIPDDTLDVLEDEEKWLANGEGRPARTREQLSTLIDPSILEEARKPQ